MTDPVSISADGLTIACADGPELLVYRPDGAPAWKVFCEGILVGVHVGAEHVVTADDQGRVVWRRRGDGGLVDAIETGAVALDLAVAEDGVVALRVRDGVWLLRHGQPMQRVERLGCAAMAWGPGGGSLAIGAEDGSFLAVDPASGVAWGSLSLEGPVSGIAWSTLGQWVVVVGARWHLISGDGANLLRQWEDRAPLSRVAVSADGLVAAALRGTEVSVMELHAVLACGELVFRRALADLRFGTGYQLVVGLDDGDATFVDLLTGALGRTEPHPGRGRNSWNMDNRVERDRLRGAIARHRAGGEPIAKWVAPSREVAESGSRWPAVLGFGCFFLSSTVICSGLIGLLWWAHTQGML